MSKGKLAGVIVACTIAIIVAIVLLSVRPWETAPSTQIYMLTADVDLSGAGSVSPSGGQYESGTQVTLTASPASGYSFDHWSGDASGTALTTTITMNSDKSITAHFTTTVPKYTLTIIVFGVGEVTSPSPGNRTYDQGTVVNLVAQAEQGYHFIHWEGDVSTVDETDASSTTITINDDCVVSAVFTEFADDPGFWPLSPEHEALNLPVTNITFNWTPRAGADAYDWLLSSNADLSSPTATKLGLTTTAYVYTGTPLTYDTRYYWMVAAYEGGSAIDTSVISVFYTMPEPP